MTKTKPVLAWGLKRGKVISMTTFDSFDQARLNCYVSLKEEIIRVQITEYKPKVKK